MNSPYLRAIRYIALSCFLSGAVLSGIGALSFYEFYSSERIYFSWPLRMANLFLVYFCFLGVGLPLLILGAISYRGVVSENVNRRLVEYVGFLSSSLPGAFLIAAVLVSLPVFPTAYVIFEGTQPTYTLDSRPRLKLGFNDDLLMLGLGLTVLLVGAMLYASLVRLELRGRAAYNFVLAYGLVIAGVFLILYPWTMGAVLQIPVRPQYCSTPPGLVSNYPFTPNECFIDYDKLGFVPATLWPVALGLAAIGLGFIYRPRPRVQRDRREV